MIGDEAIGITDKARGSWRNPWSSSKHGSSYHGCLHSFSLLNWLTSVGSAVCCPGKPVKHLSIAFVTTRIDYFNSLLYGLPARTPSPSAASPNIVARSWLKHARTTTSPSIAWSPLAPGETANRLKILTLTFRAIHGQAPEYIKELVVPYALSRSLRSTHQMLLKEPSGRLKTCGQRSFAFAAASLWNNLPTNIRTTCSVVQFQRFVKTHLFKEAFLV